MNTSTPWHVNHSNAPDWEGDWYLEGKDGFCIAMGEGWDKEQQANARLIAAAPDLLAACKAFLGVHDSGYSECECSSCALLKSAIAKATGN